MIGNERGNDKLGAPATERKRDWEPRRFEEILGEELAYIDRRREPGGPTGKEAAQPGKMEEGAGGESRGQARKVEDELSVIKRAHRSKLFGLAFSGGGIRSATFNLGVLQGLAKLDVLDEVDYVSTVSGGGYIGSWFVAWIKRQGDRGQTSAATGSSEQSSDRLSGREAQAAGSRALPNNALGDVLKQLKPEVGTDLPDRFRGALQPDPAPIRHLREYSNYLTPRRGLWSTDSWTFGATYLRNLILTTLILLGGVVTLVLATTGIASVGLDLLRPGLSAMTVPFLGGASIQALNLIGLSFCFALFASSAAIAFELSPKSESARERAQAGSGFSPLNLSVALTLISTLLATLWLWHAGHPAGDAGGGPGWVGFWRMTAGIALSAFAGGAIGYFLLQPKRRAAPGKTKTDPSFGAAQAPRILPMIWRAVAGLVGLLLLGGLFHLFQSELFPWSQSWAQHGPPTPSPERDSSGLHVMLWLGPLAVSAALALTGVAFTGIAGRTLKELHRELLSRYFAAMAKWLTLALVLLVLVLYSYPLVEHVNELLQDHVHRSGLWGSLIALWGVVSALGARLANASDQGERAESPWKSWAKHALVAIAPYVFILGLFVATIWGTHTVLTASPVDGHAELPSATVQAQPKVTDRAPNAGGFSGWAEVAGYAFFWSASRSSGDPTPAENPDHVPAAFWLPLQPEQYQPLLLALVLTAGATLVLSVSVGVNTFSLHALYGNRLVRAYLGASNLKRRAHPFHGFDRRDNDVHMKDLVPPGYQGPFPIINAAINLVDTERLAWQRRKAASFIFTPLYAGFEYYGEDNRTPVTSAGLEADTAAHEDPRGAPPPRAGGYISTRIYGGDDGVSLGRAMTISGAAASPNMGYHSKPGLTFLMTAFNVRLGWWLPNPGLPLNNPGNRLWGWLRNGMQQWRLRREGPSWGLIYLLLELLGKTSARTNYVYLSDGGHFENLGIYELVRRRCRFVIACDAEADPELQFTGLGNAIEKCRTDLGVPIRINVAQIRRATDTRLSLWHCAVGCIRYSEADPEEADGTLLYIKATRTGNEPLDVQTYASRHTAFPHESTIDQWFDETQFESYRALGEHTAHEVLGTAVRAAQIERASYGSRFKERLFLELRKQWYPQGAGSYPAPADHDAQLEAILDTMRDDSRLAFLDAQVYPNLRRTGERHSEPTGPDHPEDYEQLRAGFFFCKRLLQFMQQVFHDRRLDTEHHAPSNRGWMNLFRRWSWSRMFRFTWMITAGTYSARFQSFCENQIGLEAGVPKISDTSVRLRAHIGVWAAKDKKIDVLEWGGEKKTDWKSAKKELKLENNEQSLIEEFVRSYLTCDDFQSGCVPSPEFRVYRLSVQTEDPFEDEKLIGLNAGFFIVGPSFDEAGGHRDAVLYFRIRSSMRNMDLARRAFIEIGRHPQLKSINVDIVNDLPPVLEPAQSPLERRAQMEIHVMEKEDLNRCRWFSQLLQDINNQ